MTFFTFHWKEKRHHSLNETLHQTKSRGTPALPETILWKGRCVKFWLYIVLLYDIQSAFYDHCLKRKFYIEIISIKKERNLWHPFFEMGKDLMNLEGIALFWNRTKLGGTLILPETILYKSRWVAFLVLLAI